MFSMMILCIILLLLLLYLGLQKPKGYPPGPKWWPILGCALEFSSLRKKNHYLFKTFSVLSKKYGPIIGMKIGINHVVVLNDYESIKSMLSNEDCDGRPIGILYDKRTGGINRGLLLVDGNLWNEQRKFVLKHLRDFGFGRQSMMSIIIEESQSLVEYIKKLINDEHNIQINKSKIYCNNNEFNDGQIYKLVKKNKKDETKLINNYIINEKELKASDLYMNANEYTENNMTQSQSGTIISMHNIFGITVLNSLWKMLTGKRYNIDDKQLIYFQRILSVILNEIDMLGAPFSHFPLLRFIAPEISGYKSFVKIHEELWKFFKDEVNNHKNTFNLDSPGNLIDIYLTILNSENYGKTFSEPQLIAICEDLFMAGSETTSKVLGFCFLYLVLFPHVQKKAHEEIDRVIGRNKLPTAEDKAKMTYMNAIVLESLRMFVGRSLNLPHRVQKDTKISGYKIPKNTIIITNFNGILMDESWGDPENFRPERFIDGSGNIVTPSRFLPFSAGKHRCMGENLAKTNIFIIATTLLQAFTFSEIPGEKPTIEHFIDGTTISPKPYRVHVSLRI
ncbi:methyl farnesoate epoxidase [Apis cerana]|uniref:methyl farnesoate epoxidase n=1 Tax=Apis cerana TaxID=7461 RepID=UPI002B237A00|nr:methyl farnesoate epoxidase [Apis cerana]